MHVPRPIGMFIASSFRLSCITFDTGLVLYQKSSPVAFAMLCHRSERLGKWSGAPGLVLKGCLQARVLRTPRLANEWVGQFFERDGGNLMQKINWKFSGPWNKSILILGDIWDIYFPRSDITARALGTPLGMPETRWSDQTCWIIT